MNLRALNPIALRRELGDARLAVGLLAQAWIGVALEFSEHRAKSAREIDELHAVVEGFRIHARNKQERVTAFVLRLKQENADLADHLAVVASTSRELYTLIGTAVELTFPPSAASELADALHAHNIALIAATGEGIKA